MADNVSGNAVTDDTVRLIYPNKVEVTAKDRAQVALLYQNAETKRQKSSEHVHNLKAAYGAGTSTLCMIYNATGGDLRLSKLHNWGGDVRDSPVPPLILNGQWGGFLHVRGRLMGPSKAAVVYSGKNSEGSGCDWMLAWNTTRRKFANHVYTEIREAGHFNVDRWGLISGMMDHQPINHTDTWNGCYSTISVGGGSSPSLEATMTLAGIDTTSMALVSAFVMPGQLDSKTVDDDDDDDDDDAAPAE